MQEVEILPRDTFRHFVSVASTNTTLVYNFHTRKKNIAFGLYFISKRRSRLDDHDKESQGQELIPIRHYESSKATVKGKYLAEEAGTFVLVFDNSFSRNTSKRLTFFCALEEKPAESKPDLEGWLLKKKRKKMQGWARRWFKVENGLLSYSQFPESPCRGSLQLSTSTVTFICDRLLINIDSGTMIYHLKTFTFEDFQKWSDKIKQAKSVSLVGSGMNTPLSSIEELDIQSRVELLKESLEKGYVKIETYLDLIKESALQTKKNQAILVAVDSVQRIISSHRETVQEECRVLSKRFNEQLNLKLELSLKNLSMALDGEASESTKRGSLTKRQKAPSLCSSQAVDEVFYDAMEFELNSKDIDLSESDGNPLEYNQGDDYESDVNSLYDLPKVRFMDESSADDLDRKDPQFIKRRNQLPVPCSNEDMGIISILRKNIGKDLSNVSLPASMNEPLGVLQRLCEELEYSELLDRAASSENEINRIMYITAFAVSTYYSSRFRTGRKPFNPMLGETFECDRPDKGFRFASEKVCHYPPIFCCHAASKNCWEWYQENRPKTKFWGKSIELINGGTVYVYLKQFNEYYSWTKVKSCLRNIIGGTRYIEHYGDLMVQNHSNSSYALLSFKESGLFSSSKDEVSGFVFDSSGVKQAKLFGRWSEALYHQISADNLEVLWKGTLPPTNCSEMYGFTKFAIELNEITAGVKDFLPVTDTRHRPDQRHLEEGNLDRAESEKERIENRQREMRKVMQQEGKTWRSNWFKLEKHPINGKDFWKFDYQYWEQRDLKSFSNLPVLW